MAEYTHETLSEKMATEVMGWTAEEKPTGVILYRNARGKLVPYSGLREFGMGCELWHPTRPEGVAQALECLRQFPQVFKIELARKGLVNYNAVYWFTGGKDEYGCDKYTHIRHESLEIACCLTCASIIDGEQATLKEV